jgi:AraC family transcriptional regulator
VHKAKEVRYKNGLSSSTVDRVTAYISDLLNEEIKLIDLARLVHLSPYHFLRSFEQSLGVTPYQYILQQRLARAKLLLQTNELTIAEIATSVGFADRSCRCSIRSQDCQRSIDILWRNKSHKPPLIGNIQGIESE